MKLTYKYSFSEVRNSYTDDQNLTHIDTWLTENDNEEGRTIAVVDRDTKKVIFFDTTYIGDPQIQESIQEVLTDLNKEL